MIELMIKRYIVMASWFSTKEEGVFYMTPYLCYTYPGEEEITGFGFGIGWGHWGAVILLGWGSR